jgi:metal-sulfur cluster biosynthetic enzyme
MSVLAALWNAFRRGRTERGASDRAVRSQFTLPVTTLGDSGSEEPATAAREAEGLQGAAGAAPHVVAPPPPGTHPVWDALRTVIDPEVGLDIVTMGLVFDVGTEGGVATVTYTLTTPGCPMKDILTRSIHAAVTDLPGVARVDPVLVWEPRWHPGMIQDPATLE